MRDIEHGNKPEASSVPSEGAKQPFLSFAVSSSKNVWFTIIFVVCLGAATSAAFLAVGIQAENEVQDDEFARSALDLVKKIESAWEDYVTAAAWIHGQCRDRTFTRRDFREMYEYLLSGGLDFQAAQFDPNVTHDEREQYEQEAREFYAEKYPHVQYQGFMGINYENSTEVEQRHDASFYFPIRKSPIANAAPNVLGLPIFHP